MDGVLTVTQIVNSLRNLAEANYPTVAVIGEISNFTVASSGHAYFSLKDEASLIGATMFAIRSKGLNFTPANGLKVIALGKATIYNKTGVAQINCSMLIPSGEGPLLALIEERKKRLEAEGIFDSSKKRTIPKYPKSVAIITSPMAAALQDVLNILARRRKDLLIKIFPAQVQGDQAPATIVSALNLVNKYAASDVIILTRGGGSSEDLMAFNDEEVVRAVAASKIPVISAVGHEIDTTLCDYASDSRAPTPSAAAELLSHDENEFYKKFCAIKNSISTNILNRIKLHRAILENSSPKVLSKNLIYKIESARIECDSKNAELLQSFKNKFSSYQNRLSLLTQKLNDNSPTSLMQKGLVKVQNKNGEAITSIKKIKVDENIKIQFYDGAASAKILEI